MNFVGPVLMRNLESVSLQGFHVAQYISCLNCSRGMSAARTHTFDQLRSLELHRIEPGGFHGCHFPQLRKLVLSHLIGVVSTRSPTVVSAAGEEPESLSISIRFGRGPKSSIRKIQVYSTTRTWWVNYFEG